jgi:hypothetical protein
MKYKLINKTTGEEHICEKIVVDGWDYYVSDEATLSNNGDWYLGHPNYDTLFKWGMFGMHEGKQAWINKVIATNNPIIDIPKVVDEVDVLTNTMMNNLYWKAGFKCGYNKSQETHPNSDSDTAEFAEWLTLNTNSTSIHGEYIYKNVRRVTKELLQLWKEQRPKILYYE